MTVQLRAEMEEEETEEEVAEPEPETDAKWQVHLRIWLLSFGRGPPCHLVAQFIP